MWSLGVILYELLSNELPFYADDSLKHYLNILNQPLNLDDDKLWSNVSEEAKDLVIKLLERNP